MDGTVFLDHRTHHHLITIIMVNSVVEQVSQLLKDVEDLDVLEKCRKVVQDRYVVVSGSSSSSSGSQENDKEVSFDGNMMRRKKKKKKKASNSKDDDVTKYINFMPSMELEEDLVKSVQKDLNSMGLQKNSASANSVRYLWLSCSPVSYSFGNKTLLPNDFAKFPAVKELMGKVSKYNKTGNPFNSCLVSYYRDGTVSLPLHRDDESIFDVSAPVGNISFGSTRTIEFKKQKADSIPAATYNLSHKSALFMIPGCQQKYFHEVVKSEEPTGWRYCLSFRVVSKEVVSKCNYTPDTDGYQHQPKVDNNIPSNILNRKVGEDKPVSVEHVIIGDSLIRNIVLPNTLNICKGGARPHDLGKLLSEKVDELEIDTNKIKSVTISVGTNMLEFDRKIKGFIPMMEVYSDYDQFVRMCMGIFPNAKLLLFNITPRKYCFRYTHDRICLLNLFIRDLEMTYLGRVEYIALYDEFLYNGWLNTRLYNLDKLHFSGEGVKLVSGAIHRAQNDVMDEQDCMGDLFH